MKLLYLFKKVNTEVAKPLSCMRKPRKWTLESRVSLRRGCRVRKTSSDVLRAPACSLRPWHYCKDLLHEEATKKFILPGERNLQKPRFYLDSQLAGSSRQINPPAENTIPPKPPFCVLKRPLHLEHREGRGLSPGNTRSMTLSQKALSGCGTFSLCVCLCLCW